MMGPIKLNLPVVTTASLMVCLLTTAALVTVGHTAIVTAADDDGDVAATTTTAVTAVVANATIVNRKVTADGGHRIDGGLPSPPSTPAVVGRGKPTASAAESCRETCSKQHSTKESLCSQRRNCSTCQRKCILENLSPSNKDSTHRLSLVLLQMTRNESLVTADVAWVNAADSRSRSNHSQQQQQSQEQQQCLVTWEVSGGGLMGNLLTESSTVQLSLWAETNYRVQVTCRSKRTNSLVRSSPIVLKTSAATSVGHSQSKRPTTGAETTGTQLGIEELVPVSHPEGSPSNEQNCVQPDGLREVLLFGVYITLVVFLMILLTVVSCVNQRHKAISLEKTSSSSDASSISSDTHVLVVNDVMATEILHV
ncbi:transmembrane protein fend-like [Armigeres subalbatus]|uniref:transmembrane protein fend-like n=1 Tax=Armigeres subalbatus TaxID=124917 RepID=UPI002ED66AC9